MLIEKGNRPSFTKAQEPAKAVANYAEFNQKLQALGDRSSNWRIWGRYASEFGK